MASKPSEIPDMEYEEKDCWQCGGEGGWASCFEDCCPAVGGEDGCTDERCWRECDVCLGVGSY